MEKLWLFGLFTGDKSDNIDMWMIKITIKANQIDMGVLPISKVDYLMYTGKNYSILIGWEFIRNLRTNSVIRGKLRDLKGKICNSFWTQIQKGIND